LRVLKAVGDDESLLIEHDAGRLQVQLRDIRRTADGPQQAIEAGKLAAVGAAMSDFMPEVLA
jgi:hypothetical protein